MCQSVVAGGTVVLCAVLCRAVSGVAKLEQHSVHPQQARVAHVPSKQTAGRPGWVRWAHMWRFDLQ